MSRSATFLTVDGVEIETIWTGERSGGRPEIVLLHEGLGSVAMWKDFPQRLLETTGCAVFAYSRRGHGQSDPLVAPREPDYMHHEAEAVLPALLSAAGIDRPVLFGHSDGASIALLFAARHPQSVQGLILEAPHVFVEPLTVESIAAVKTAYETTDFGAKLGRYHRRPDHVFWGWNDIWLDARFAHWNIEDCLPAIDCPMLLIQGRDDEYGTFAQLDAIRERNNRAEIMILEHCGHSPHRDQAQAVLAATERFVGAMSPVGAG